MRRYRLGLLVAAALLASIAAAKADDALVVQTCGTLPLAYKPGQRLPLTIDTTGKLCSGSSGGAGSNAVYGPDAVGSSSTQPPVRNGYNDASGNVQAVAPATPFPTADQNASQTITTPGANSTKAQGVQGVPSGVPIITTPNQPQPITLLSNASASGSPTTLSLGTSYIFSLVGTFGTGCTVTVQSLGPDGTTYQTLASYTAAQAGVGFQFGVGATVKATVAGTCTGLYAKLAVTS